MANLPDMPTSASTVLPEMPPIASPLSTFVDKVGEHIGVPFTDYDLKHAASRITGAMGGDVPTEAADQASAEANPKAAIAGSLTGGAIGMGAAGAAVGAASKGAQAAWQARKLAILQEQAAKINAAQDAAHIQAVAQAIAPRAWNSGVGQRVSQFLKDDAEASLAPKTPGTGGGPQWDVPGQLPKPPTDVTPADLVRAQKAAAEASAGGSTRAILKNPMFWQILAGSAAGAGGAGVWGAMSASYHARQLLRNLSNIFGE